MDVSVIVPTYNRADALLSTLSSLISQDCDASFEIIVCDDGSSDNTKEVVDDLRPHAELDLRYIAQPRKGHRPSAARNMGLKCSSGEFIVLLDDDMLVPSSFLSEHISSQADGVTATIGYRYNLELVEPETYILLEDARIEQFASYPEISRPLWTIFETCNVSFNRQALDRAGKFDEGFSGWGVEDIEFGYRLHKSGANLRLNSQAYGWHQFDSDPHNPFVRRARNLRPDFSSQINNLDFFRAKYPDDSELQKILMIWASRLREVQSRTNDARFEDRWRSQGSDAN